MKPKFWKLSQGAGIFTFQAMLESVAQGYVLVHKNTPPKGKSSQSQAEDFIAAPIGDYFYLTHGNHGVYLLGQFSGPANLFSTKKGGWLDRPFRLIRVAVAHTYAGPDRWWAPNHNSTFAEVPDDQLAEFEQHILMPYFGIKFADYED